MLIDPLLDDILRWCSPTDRDFAIAADRTERVGAIFVRDRRFGALDFEVGGSCAKATALAPLNDIDLFVYLDPEEWKTVGGELKKPATVLGEFERRIRQTYKPHIDAGDVQVRGQEHSIRIRYTSGSSACIDVVPALWDGDKAYRVEIPERGQKEWKLTSVRRQRLLLDRLDTRGRFLRRGIRLLKLWRSEFGLDLRSYALEVLAIHSIRRIEKQHPRAVLLETLRWIADTELDEPTYVTDFIRAGEYRIPRGQTVVVLDPAVPGNNVTDGMLLGEKRAIATQARRTVRKLEKAEALLNKDQLRAAKLEVREALGLRRAE